MFVIAHRLSTVRNADAILAVSYTHLDVYKRQVPMFWPNRTYTALERGIRPLEASACKMPTEAEEDLSLIHISQKWTRPWKPCSPPVPGRGNWDLIQRP